MCVYNAYISIYIYIYIYTFCFVRNHTRPLAHKWTTGGTLAAAIEYHLIKRWEAKRALSHQNAPEAARRRAPWVIRRLSRQRLRPPRQRLRPPRQRQRALTVLGGPTGRSRCAGGAWRSRVSWLWPYETRRACA